MPALGSLSYVYGPALALLALMALIAVLRWSSRRGGSLVARQVQPATLDEYGVLVSIAAPATYADGEMQRRRLEDSGIRATLAHTLDGPRIMVFPDDEALARRALAG